MRLERRASHEGMVSVGGNLYSVPDTTRRRVFDVHVLADEIRIFEDEALIATHGPAGRTWREAARSFPSQTHLLVPPQPARS
jgi:Mu transposase, C-terminal domain